MSGLSQTLQTLIYPVVGVALLVVNHLLLSDNATVNGVAIAIIGVGMAAFTHGAYQQPPK